MEKYGIFRRCKENPHGLQKGTSFFPDKPFDPHPRHLKKYYTTIAQVQVFDALKIDG